MSAAGYIVASGFLILAFILYINWSRIKKVLFPKGDSIERIRICPRCGSQNVTSSKISYIGDPFKIEGMIGWDCLDCKYTGKDFIIGDEKTIKKYRQNKKV